MKLTIITINLNHKEGLQRTIDSIVNQTFTDYEWIVIDGGSTDGSKELLEQYQSHISWWCSEPDKGLYNAMNKGIAHAIGEYINFMNSGDVFATPTILENVFENPHDADILYGIMVRGSIDGAVNNKSMMKTKLNWWDFYNSTFNHQATFTKLELFNKYGCYDESYRALADWRHFAELVAVHRCSCEYLPHIIAIYEGGGISDDNNIWPKEMQRLRDEVFPAIRPSDIEDLYFVNLCKQHALSAKLHHLLTHGTRWLLRKFNKL